MSLHDKFPLSGDECESLRNKLMAMQDNACEAGNYDGHDAIRACLKMLHDARMNAFDDHLQRLTIKRAKARA